MRFLLLPALAILTGCAGDPFLREGSWHPAGVNDANLRAMIVDPTHLARGVEGRGNDGHLAAKAVERLRARRVPPLPESGISTIGGTGGSQPPPDPDQGSGS